MFRRIAAAAVVTFALSSLPAAAQTLSPRPLRFAEADAAAAVA
jgi:hypothetical protein